MITWEKRKNCYLVSSIYDDLLWSAFPAALLPHPAEADTMRCLTMSACNGKAANASYQEAASTNESAGTPTDKPSAGGKENKRQRTHQDPTILQLVCRANKCKTATFAWTVRSQEYYTTNKLPPPRFCTACADKRSKRNQRQLANMSVNKKRFDGQSGCLNRTSGTRWQPCTTARAHLHGICHRDARGVVVLTVRQITSLPRLPDFKTRVLASKRGCE